LVYQPGSGQTGDTELVTVDRSGGDVVVVGPLAEYYAPRLSHDGRLLAMDSTLIQTTQGDIWVFDLARGTRTRLAASPRDETSPVWSPDDSTVFYRRVPDLFSRDVAGAKRELPVFSSGLSKKPSDMAPDGRTLLFEVDTGDDLDIWALDLESGTARPWLDQPYREEAGRFSPDGRWVAYDSEESGIAEVYVRSFPDAESRIVVSVEGGTSPVWSADGRELFYYSAASEITAVPVSWSGGAPRFGRPRALFRARLREGATEFDVFPDGQRFLLNRVVPSNSVGHLVMIQNWSAEDDGR
jgi:Tol biopolymer transport system component